MDQPVDIINATIDALILHQVELPAFSTLDNIAEQIHTRTQTALFRRVARRLSDEERQRLDRLLVREFTNRLTAYNNIKRHARRPSRKHLNLLVEHLPYSMVLAISLMRSQTFRPRSCAHWPVRP